MYFTIPYCIYLLRICGITDINVEDIAQKGNAFTKQINESLKKSFVNRWTRSAETRTEGKLRFYYELKRHFTFEKYLDLIPRKERKAITRLRISSHTLPIEVLRYQGVTHEGDRKCDICKTNEIGD